MAHTALTYGSPRRCGCVGCMFTIKIQLNFLGFFRAPFFIASFYIRRISLDAEHCACHAIVCKQRQTQPATFHIHGGKENVEQIRDSVYVPPICAIAIDSLP